MYSNHPFQSRQNRLRHRTRRHFFQDCGVGLGSVALASLLKPHGLLGAETTPDPLAPKPTHFPPKAKRVIYLFMAGAPSQLDLITSPS